VPTVDNLDQASVFWFGSISPETNATDVRVGYTPSELIIYLATFDRRLWFDATPDAASLDQWDAATLYMTASDDPDAPRLRVVTQMNFARAAAEARRIERWTGSGWTPTELTLTTLSGWRGERLNQDLDARGWAQTFRIPFAALGLPAAPTGARLRFALTVHDRDGLEGPVRTPSVWPVAMQPSDPGTWATLTIGAPGRQAPAIPTTGEMTLRRAHQSDTAVADASVGGSSDNLCGDQSGHFWDQWPNLNYGAAPGTNIQNQIDVADWPCYARYFISFELDALPPGKVIKQATLTLHQWGNSGPRTLARPSYIQVMRVDRAWEEDAITWNNAPQVLEHIGGAWVPVLQEQPAWPGIPRQWDVSKAVADAYAVGEPVRLGMYSADSGYHSGKLFVASDTGDWNGAGRPALHIVWGDK
jgi:hypothetical protein